MAAGRLPAAGTLLVGLTGFLEGPAYSGTIAIRQRRSPPAVRAAVMSTLNGFTLATSAAGSAVAGWLGRPLPVIFLFTAVNLAAAGVCVGRNRVRPRRRLPPQPLAAPGAPTPPRR